MRALKQGYTEKRAKFAEFLLFYAEIQGSAAIAAMRKKIAAFGDVSADINHIISVLAQIASIERRVRCGGTGSAK